MSNFAQFIDHALSTLNGSEHQHFHRSESTLGLRLRFTLRLAQCTLREIAQNRLAALSGEPAVRELLDALAPVHDEEDCRSLLLVSYARFASEAIMLQAQGPETEQQLSRLHNLHGLLTALTDLIEKPARGVVDDFLYKNLRNLTA